MILKPMTAQEAFDKAVAGVRAQGYQLSLDEKTNCMYRGPNGLRCAVGHLIPDELYQPAFEGVTGDGLIGLHLDHIKRGIDLERLAHLRQLLPDSLAPLLSELQGLHDGIESDCEGIPAEFEDGFRAIAKNFGLVYTEPSEVVA